MGNKIKISKWGNSLALRIPKSISDELNLEDGMELQVYSEQGKIIIEPDSWSNFIKVLTDFKYSIEEIDSVKENHFSSSPDKSPEELERSWNQFVNKLREFQKDFLPIKQPFNPNQSWVKFIQELTTFKNEFGHCIVPKDYEDQWLVSKVNNIIINYRKGKLSRQQIKQLEEMGFVWKVK